MENTHTNIYDLPPEIIRSVPIVLQYATTSRPSLPPPPWPHTAPSKTRYPGFALILSFARTSSHFYSILQPLLYHLDLTSLHPAALTWAVSHGRLDTLEIALHVPGPGD